MALTVPRPDDPRVVSALEKVLLAHIKEQLTATLRTELTKLVDAKVNEAVGLAMPKFEEHLRMYVDEMSRDYVLDVVLKFNGKEVTSATNYSPSGA